MQPWPICRKFLGVVLLVAAGMEAHELATLPILPQRLFAQRWFWLTAVEAEGVLGAWLILGRGARRTWGVALGVWTVFLAVTIFELIAGADSCQCFGRAQVDPRYTASLDAFCIGLLWLARPRNGTSVEPGKIARWRVASISALALAGAAFATWNLRHFSDASQAQYGMTLAGGTVLLTPHQWIGRRFTLADYTNMGPQILHGDCVVLLYHHDCEHCRRAVSRYVEWSRRNARLPPARVALVEMPPYAGADARAGPIPSSVSTGRLTDARDWFTSTPVAIKLHDGVVSAVGEGEDGETTQWLDADLSSSATAFASQ